ncbi:unnamed protein product [Ceratitis capitata]|uniref:(Mediterranean fruit fly) hypothetical protein n=1 Tax=Ceratitis capitata TaxID=7213 RepID=A0A811V683_CERCA|nr:unnamed protein product [Ceratitis capitata]
MQKFQKILTTTHIQTVLEDKQVVDNQLVEFRKTKSGFPMRQCLTAQHSTTTSDISRKFKLAENNNKPIPKQNLLPAAHTFLNICTCIYISKFYICLISFVEPTILLNEIGTHRRGVNGVRYARRRAAGQYGARNVTNILGNSLRVVCMYMGTYDAEGGKHLNSILLEKH